jgi:transcriptional regulator with XRE-family HTH domain
MASRNNNNLKKDLGQKLKNAREKAGLTQAQVAEKSGLHVNYYARIERGEENPTFDKLENIMKTLNIKL